jgi:TolB-like protein
MKNLIFFFGSTIHLFVCLGVSFPQGGLDQRVTELSQQIAKEMTEYQKATIDVVEFSDLQGNVTDFGRFLAEELITRLFNTKKFKVIERQLLNKVITEQKLSLMGLVDPSSAKQLGKLLGVDAIASGTISELAQSLRVNARLISTETGEIFAVASTEIFKDESVTRLMSLSKVTKSTESKSENTAVTKSSTLQKVEAKNFAFELREAKMSGTSLTIELTIKNNDQDRELILLRTAWIGGPSRIFDEVGNEYIADNIKIGNKQSGSSHNVRSLFVSGVPTKVKLIFDKVSPEMNTISLFEIGGESNGKFKAQLRNIPITK